MNARQIAGLAVTAIQYAPEEYMELLQNEQYDEMADAMAEFIAEE